MSEKVSDEVLQVCDEIAKDSLKVARELLELRAERKASVPVSRWGAQKFVSEWLWNSADRLSTGEPWQDTHKADAIKMCVEFAKLCALSRQEGKT